MEQNLKRQLKLPIILSLIFIISSFMPIIQILILTIDGGLIGIIDRIIDSKNNENILTTTNVIVNLIPSLFQLLIFYKTTNKILKAISASLSMIFMTAFFTFLFDDFTKDSSPYYLNFLIVALICGFILILFATIKYKLNQSDYKNQ